MTEPALPRDLPSLTSLRAPAALMVFVFHLGVYGLPHHAGYIGYVGVSFFFVLSGFVLTWGYSYTGSTMKFYARRIARIFPSHLTVWLLVLLFPIVALEKNTGSVMLNAVLLQAWSASDEVVYGMNGVAWSLSCEIAFYAVFPFAVSALGKVRLSTAWTIAGVAYAVANSLVLFVSQTRTAAEPLFVIASANPLVRFPEFLIGIVLAMSLKTGWRLRPTNAVWIVLISVIGLLVAHDKPAGSTWAAPIFAVVIALAVQRDFSGPNVLGSGWLVYLGKVSFCFYLVHQLTIATLNANLTPGFRVSALALGVSLILAIGLHHLIEKPSHRLVVSAMRSRKPTISTDPVG